MCQVVWKEVWSLRIVVGTVGGGMSQNRHRTGKSGRQSGGRSASSGLGQPCNAYLSGIYRIPIPRNSTFNGLPAHGVSILCNAITIWTIIVFTVYGERRGRVEVSILRFYLGLSVIRSWCFYYQGRLYVQLDPSARKDCKYCRVRLICMCHVMSPSLLCLYHIWQLISPLTSC